LAQLTVEDKRKVRKPLLLIGLASIVMTFAGLTSGYVVSRSALIADSQWLEFALPEQFYWATAAIVLSSISMVIAKNQIKKGKSGVAKTAVLITLVLGLAFALLQYLGWMNLIDRGLYFTGEGSNTAISWVYVITMLHWAHVIAGIIVLSVTLLRANAGAYTAKSYQGLSMASIFWHFLDALWIYLFLFLVFIR